jgi:mutator protein MutT
MTSFPSINPKWVKSGVSIRIYGILINEQQQILVSDEYYYGKMITKFPGGGIEFGETTVECLVREWQEELGLRIEVDSHIYTSDVFQTFPFRDDVQVVSIYYFVKSQTGQEINARNIPFDFPVTNDADHRMAVRWIDKEMFSPESMTFPADKAVAAIVVDRII